MRSGSSTKDRLLEVALRLISENSYGSVSVDDICQQAGVKKGSFYHFFPSKSDLMAAAMEADWQTGQARLDSVFSPQIPALDRLDRYFEMACECQLAKQRECGKVCGCPMITLGAELSTQDEKIRRQAEQLIDRYIRYFESALREAASEGLIETDNPRQMAEALFATFQGALLQAKIRNHLGPLQSLQTCWRQMLPIRQHAGT